MPKQAKFAPASFESAVFEGASFSAHDEPPEIEYTGDPEVDCKLELNAMQSAFRDRAANEAKRYTKATETGYWVCLCFQTREQADAFAMATAGRTDRFADGVKIARKLGIEIPVDDVPFGKGRAIDRKFADISLPIEP